MKKKKKVKENENEKRRKKKEEKKEKKKKKGGEDGEEDGEEEGEESNASPLVEGKRSRGTTFRMEKCRLRAGCRPTGTSSAGREAACRPAETTLRDWNP